VYKLHLNFEEFFYTILPVFFSYEKKILILAGSQDNSVRVREKKKTCKSFFYKFNSQKRAGSSIRKNTGFGSALNQGGFETLTAPIKYAPFIVPSSKKKLLTRKTMV
jgi:hypothetical protein